MPPIKGRLGRAASAHQTGGVANLHPGQHLRMGPSRHRKASFSRCRPVHPRKNAKEHLGRRDRPFYALGRRRIWRGSLFRGHLSGPGNGSIPTGLVNVPRDAALSAILRRHRQRQQPFCRRQQQQIQTSHRQPGDGASPSCALIDEYHEHKTPPCMTRCKPAWAPARSRSSWSSPRQGRTSPARATLHQVRLQKVLEGSSTMTNASASFSGLTKGRLDDRRIPAQSQPELRRLDRQRLPQTAAARRHLRPSQTERLQDQAPQRLGSCRFPWLNLHALQKLEIPPDARIDAWKSAGRPRPGQQSRPRIGGLSFEEEVDGESHYTAISRNYLPESAVDKPKTPTTKPGSPPVISSSRQAT